MIRHPRSIPMELREWARDVRRLRQEIDVRRFDLRTHGPAEVVDPLRAALDRAAADLSRIRDDLLAAATELEAAEREEVPHAA